MTDVAIRLQGVSKKYRIFDSPRQRLKEALDPFARTYHRDFWALKDIDLVVPKGQTVGIIGRNGSGKSTLLQIITSVLQPTSGAVEVAGRIAALLELGAGFDPDFTGRQNVRQFGRLQGLRRDEIEGRLPAAEAFANIGDFFDRPVKTYSSGMFARVAFAAAINVDPDILILDEIMAVGDVRFQQRCFERIRHLQENGTTVLLVTHALEAVIDHCDAAVVLDRGRLVAEGQPKRMVDRYNELIFAEIAQEVAALPSKSRRRAETGGDDLPRIVREMLDEETDRDRFSSRPGFNSEESVSGSGDAELLDYRIVVDGVESEKNTFVAGQQIRLYVLATSKDWAAGSEFGFSLRRVDGVYIYGTNSTMRPASFQSWNSGERFVCSFAFSLTIQSGHYFLDMAAFRKVNGDDIILRARRNCIHLVVHHTPDFDGIADLDSPAL